MWKLKINRNIGTDFVTHLWTSISWISLWEQIPDQDFSIRSNFWKIKRIIDTVQGKIPWLIEKIFISNNSKLGDYYHIWTSIFLISRWETIPIQDLSIWSKFFRKRRIIDRVEGKILWWIEKHFIRTHSKWSTYYNLWTSI